MPDTSDPRGPNVHSLDKFRQARTAQTQQQEAPKQLEGPPDPRRVLFEQTVQGIKTLSLPLVYRPRAAAIALTLSEDQLASQLLGEVIRDWNMAKSIQVPEGSKLKLDIDLAVLMDSLSTLSNTIDEEAAETHGKELESLAERTRSLIHDVITFIEPSEDDVEQIFNEADGELLDRMIFTQAKAEELRAAAEMGQKPTRRQVEMAFVDSWSGLEPELAHKIRLEAVNEYAPLILEHLEYQSEIFGRTVAQLVELTEGSVGPYEDLLDQFEDLLTNTDTPEENRVQMLFLLQRSFYKRADEHLKGESDEARKERQSALAWFWSELCARLEIEHQGELVGQTMPALDPPSSEVSAGHAVRLANRDLQPGSDQYGERILELQKWYGTEMKQADIDYHRIAHIGALLHKERAHSGSAQSTYTEIERMLAGRMHQNEEVRESFLQLMAETGQPLTQIATPDEWLMVSRVAYFTRKKDVLVYANELLKRTGLTTTLNRDEVPWENVLAHYAVMAEMTE